MYSGFPANNLIVKCIGQTQTPCWNKFKQWERFQTLEHCLKASLNLCVWKTLSTCSKTWFQRLFEKRPVEKKHPRSSDLAHITDSGESIGKAITFNRHASGRPFGNIRSLNTSQFLHVFIRSGNILLCTFSNWLGTVVIVLCMHQTKSSEVTVLVMYFLEWSDQF